MAMQRLLPMEIKHTPRRKKHHRRAKRMTIGASIFSTLMNTKLPRADALSEFIDNSFGPAAGDASTVWIEFRKNKIVVRDNGVGVRDLNALLTPGESHSRHSPNDIGSFGIGAKFGMFHFGTKVKVDTVREGLRHTYEIDFAQAIEKNQMPRLYAGSGHSTSKPSGTEIIISNLHQGRHNPSYKYLIDLLAHRYLLAQRDGRKILMRWPQSTEFHELKADDVVRLFEQDVRQHSGEIKGKGFTVLAGDIKEYNSNLSGMHIGYGFRFINKQTELAGQALPPLFYGRVILDQSWKHSLSTDKTQIITDKDELEAAIYELLKDWIEQLRKLSEEFRTERICTRLATAFAGLMAVLGSGTAKTIKSQFGGGIGDGGNGGDGGPNPSEKGEANGGDMTTKPNDRDATGIKFSFDYLGQNTPYRILHGGTDLTVQFNLDMPNIYRAHEAPFRLPVIWGIAAMALAVHCTRPGYARRMLCNEDILGEVELETPEGFSNAVERIAAYLMQAQPPEEIFAETVIDERGA